MSRTDPLLKTETLVLDRNDNVTSHTDRKGQQPLGLQVDAPPL